MLHELLVALVRRGHSATLVVTDVDDKPTTVDGVRVLHGREYLDSLPGTYDLLVSHHKESPDALEMAHRDGRPSVLLVHSDLPYNRKFFEASPSLVVYNTEWVRRHWTKQGVTSPSVVVHPPVYRADHETTRGDMVTLVNAIPAKGVTTFEAVARRMPSTRFLLVGGGYLQSQQRRVRLSNVVWQDHTDDMRRDVWSRTRILLMPSSYESYGMVGVEAMHSGIPVIAHPTPGTREMLGKAGTFVSRTDTRRWQTAIRQLWNSRLASESARARARELDPEPELSTFADRAEELCG